MTNVASLSKWKKQLITHEDPGHVHKTLGICCLISYIWRLSMTGPSDMGFLTYPSLTLPTILMHWSLTLSSFIFNIPSKRIKSGDRIWPEYRLHALVFLSRSLLICCLIYYEQYFQLPPNYDMNIVIVFLTLLAADASSMSVEHRSGSIRDLDTHPAVKYFFSMMQFGATSACLYGNRRYSLQFYACFVVQINPFLMTLRRKNLLSKNVVVTFYGVMLAYAFSFAIHEFITYAPNGFNSFLCIGFLESVASILRLGPRVPFVRYIQDNKYVLWIVVAMLCRYIRPYFDVVPLPSNTLALALGGRALQFSLGIWKGFIRDRYNKKSNSDETTNATPYVNGNPDTKKVA